MSILRAVLLLGPIAAGKSTLIQWMRKNRILPFDHIVLIDMDEIRDMLPESESLRCSDPYNFGSLTQKESGFIAELTTLVAISRGLSVLVDGTMVDLAWQQAYLSNLRDKFPAIGIAIIHVATPAEQILNRINERSFNSKRCVPDDILIPRLKVRSPLIHIN